VCALDRLSPGPFSLDIGTTEKLVLNANGAPNIVINDLTGTAVQRSLSIGPAAGWTPSPLMARSATTRLP
jgi:hypothetical protein